jgi:hypothetical protein
MSGPDSNPPEPGAICFGLSLELDQQSCAAYLQLLGRFEMAHTLCSRLSQEEIDQLIGLISGLMRNHMTRYEYHTLFLGEELSHHGPDDQ